MSATVAASPLPGDDHLLLLSLVATVALQLACFGVAWTLQVDLLTDLAGSANFVLLALLSFFLGQAGGDNGGGGGGPSRALVITALVCLCRLELAAFLLYRVCRRGHDARFDAMRARFLPFLFFWVFQMVWVWVVCLPCVFVNADLPAAAAPPLFAPQGRAAACDAAGLAMFAAGFAVEAAADLQKDRFRRDPANRGRVCAEGLWRYSRHPNFFGEMLLWWGIFVLSLPALDASPARWGYAAAAASPLLTMVLLLFVSGMPTAEGNNQLRFMRGVDARARYEAYRWRTSPIVPLPNALYAATPLAVKRWLLLELSMYEATDEAAAALQPLGGGGGAGGGGGGVGGGGEGGGDAGEGTKGVAEFR